MSTAPYTAVSANPGDPNQVAVGDEHGVVAVWDLRAGRVLDQFERQHDGIVRRLMYHPKVCDWGVCCYDFRRPRSTSHCFWWLLFVFRRSTHT